MSLTLAELQDLLRRSQLSVQRGYSIARGTHYAEALGGTDGSAAGLLALCRSALEATAEEVAPPAAAEPPDTSTWPPAGTDAPAAMPDFGPQEAAPVDAPDDVELPEDETADEPEDASDEASGSSGTEGAAAQKPARRRKRR